MRLDNDLAPAGRWRRVIRAMSLSALVGAGSVHGVAAAPAAVDLAAERAALADAERAFEVRFYRTGVLPAVGREAAAGARSQRPARPAVPPG